MAQNEKLTCRQCELGEGAAGLVTEFDLVRAIQYFYDRPHLPTDEPMLRQVGEKRNDVELIRVGVHNDGLYFT